MIHEKVIFMYLEEVIETLKTKDKRITKTKVEMIEFFLKNKEFINVSDLRDRLSVKPDMSTLYRNLEAFCEIGFLEKMQKDDRRWYRLKENSEFHEHYIVCEKCGKRKKLDFCPVFITDRKVEGYEVTGHRFEMLGICEDCL